MIQNYQASNQEALYVFVKW